MKLYKNLKDIGIVVMTHSVMLSHLSGYKNPNDKIKQMVKDGELIRLRRGLYMVGDIYRNKPISKGLVANQLYGPSYVSMDFALSFYGLIPERVYEVTSVTTKMAKEYKTPIGRFTYVKSPVSLYQIGLSIYEQSDGISYIIAGEEKALCDKIVFTKNLNLTSLKMTIEYLEDDLRIDLDDLKSFDLSIIKQCSQKGYKSNSLKLLQKAIEKIRE